MTTPEVLVTTATLDRQTLDNQLLDNQLLGNQLLDDHEQRYYNERGKYMPSRLHALVQMRLMAALLRFADRYDILPELSLELVGNHLTPDICVMPKSPADWSKDSIRVTEPPLLAIEIVSPKQPLSDVIDKKEEYFTGGVAAFWLVVPQLQELVVFALDATRTIVTSGIITDPHTGVSIDLDEVFR